MKLALIGGGGVRAPLFVGSALRRAAKVGLTEICLMDVDVERLAIFGGLCQEVARRAHSAVQITTTTDAREAFTDARYVVTTVRVGGEGGRVLDERIALRYGVLGQETTGPGGFAMALRSVPVILEYARLLREVSPQAWIFNFTNPAGLVTQALRDHGFDRTVGICDSANTAPLAIAKQLDVDQDRLRAEVFGLNHLSWTRRVLLDDRDVLAPLLRDRSFLANTIQRMFDPELVQQIGMWLNEYLYYYYYAERALDSIRNDTQTRGEEIVQLNQQLIAQLRAVDVSRDPQRALQTFWAYQNRRHATYMHYAQPDHLDDAPDPQAVEESAAENEDGEGYAGVALSIIEALETGEPLYTGLNIPNDGAITAMQPSDVVEISAVVDRDGVRPLPIGSIPEPQALLMRSIKLFERLTLQAIATHSRSTAVAALMAHPLVLSYSRATALVDDYLLAHAAHVGSWS